MKKNRIFVLILCLIFIISGCGRNSEAQDPEMDTEASGNTSVSAESQNPDDLTLTPAKPDADSENPAGTDNTESKADSTENTGSTDGNSENTTGNTENADGSSESSSENTEKTDSSTENTAGSTDGNSENAAGNAGSSDGSSENSSENTEKTDNSAENTAGSTDGNSENTAGNTENADGSSENAAGNAENTGNTDISTENTAESTEGNKEVSSEKNTDYNKEYTVVDIENYRSEKIALTADLQYAEFSAISTGEATLYYSESSERNGLTVCVNAGHGTKGGESVKTYCHPDKTEKVTGGTTSAGSTKAIAVSSGMTFSDGTPEKKVNLATALKVRDKLLARGYNVLMIRDTDDVQLDNVARTILANNYSDCHIAIHFDSTESNKGAYFTSVPNVKSYRSMEPVASNWEKHHALGYALLDGMKANGIKIWSDGILPVDLTQTSFSTIASVDVELGDKATRHDDAALDILAEGLADGIDKYFGY